MVNDFSIVDIQSAIITYRWLSGKLWYLQHNCVEDTIVYHSDSDI